MQTNKAYDEVIEFIASSNPQNVHRDGKRNLNRFPIFVLQTR